nr:sialidase family protein [Caldilineaceae bacterium]
MSDQSTPILDVRGLPGTSEVIAYQDGGLFPVLALAGDAVVAVLRGGAGHLGLDGRIEVVRSLDAGHTWSPPAVVADSDFDDRNP